MRAELDEIVSGWMLIDGMEDLTDRTERSAEWMRQNGLKLEDLALDEQKTIEMMIQAQVERGIRRGDFLPYIGTEPGSACLGDDDECDEDEEPEAGENPRLGKCCVCEREDATVRNICMLPKRSPEPGTGCWSCVVCGLPAAGAIAVICDECLETGGWGGGSLIVKFACLGAPVENRRIPVEQLTEPFDHERSDHDKSVRS